MKIGIQGGLGAYSHIAVENLYKDADIKTIQRKIRKDRQKVASSKTLQNLGISLSIPSNYNLVEDNGEFLWYRYRITGNNGMELGSSIEIFAYSVPISSEEDENGNTIVAIRNACTELNTFDLSGCEMYTSCEPCPMCLSAIYWSHIDIVYYGNSRENAAEIEFDDKFIYDEIKKEISARKIPLKRILKDEAIKAFNLWAQTENKTKY